MRSEAERETDGPQGRELDVRALGRALGRHRKWIIAPTLGCCLAATAFVSLVHPRYTADAKVIIENGESYFTRPDKGDLQQPPPLPDDEAVQSEVQLISSRDIAREAIRRLDLKGNPEFDPLAKGIGPLSRIMILVGLERDPTSVSPEDRMLQNYYDRLQVFPVVKSRVIAIEFTATDRDLAARAANTIADLYIEAQSEAKRARARVAAESLATLIADLRTRAAAAESKADEFRSRSGLLVGTNNTTITAQQLADITTQLAQARTAEADAQAKAKLIREMIRQGRISEVPDVANNELIRRISERRVSLKADIALQSRTLLPGHPHMQELAAQLQDVDSQLRLAADKAARTLENDARIAASRVDNLSTALDLQKKTASTAGVDQVQLNTLESQARLLKDQLEFNTSKYQEALARESATSRPADARVISQADPPQLPSFPKKLPIIAIATLAGLILSIGALVARELLSGRPFETDGGTEDATVEPLGLRPALAAESAPDERPATSVQTTAEDVITALRALRASHDGALATRVLALTVSPSAEGAAATLTLARHLAGEARTILVDCDHRAPAVLAASIAPAGGQGAAAEGLSELLTGTATFAEIIHRDPNSRLHVVPVGLAGLPTGRNGDYDLVIEALAETYDFVLLHAAGNEHALVDTLLRDVDAVVVLRTEADAPAVVEAMGSRLAGQRPVPVEVVDAGTLAPAADVIRAA